MGIQKEKYFSFPVHTKLHDHSPNAHERIGLEVFSIGYGLKGMHCLSCGHTFISVKNNDGKYPERHYQCRNCNSNALFWTPQEQRGPKWALAVLNRMNALMVKECDTLELEGELSRFQEVLRILVEYVRDPHSTRWGSSWVGFLACAYCPTVSFRDIKGDTPRLKTVWHMLAHLEQYDPKAMIQRNAVDELADTVTGMIHLSSPIDHEAILAKATSLRDVTTPPVSSLKPLIIDALYRQ